MNNRVNEANKSHEEGGVDPIIRTARNITIRLSKGTTRYNLSVPGGWVTATGGEYMFSPGIWFFSNVL